MADARDKIRVTVSFPHGIWSKEVFFWQSDESIIRDAIHSLGSFAPSPDKCKVFRDEGANRG